MTGDWSKGAGVGKRSRWPRWRHVIYVQYWPLHDPSPRSPRAQPDCCLVATVTGTDWRSRGHRDDKCAMVTRDVSDKHLLCCGDSPQQQLLRSA